MFTFKCRSWFGGTGLEPAVKLLTHPKNHNAGASSLVSGHTGESSALDRVRNRRLRRGYRFISATEQRHRLNSSRMDSFRSQETTPDICVTSVIRSHSIRNTVCKTAEEWNIERTVKIETSQFWGKPKFLEQLFILQHPFYIRQLRKGLMSVVEHLFFP